jgi:GNAT superfamily N-acetyltransferase
MLMNELRIITPDLSYATAISALIVSLAPAFMEPDTDPTKFLESVSPEAEADYMRDARYFYRIALLDDRFVGIVAIRDYSHLTHLFVSPDVQNSGIGNALWQSALKEMRTLGTKTVTVFASPQAVPFYVRAGFEVTDDARSANGVRVHPMRLDLARSA